MKINQLVLQFLENQKKYSVQELRQQLTRFDKKQIPAADLSDVLDLLAGNRNDRGYILKVHDLSGSFERQAYFIDKARKEGGWTLDLIVFFSILVHCARIEPRLAMEQDSIFYSLLKNLVTR